MKEKLVLSVKQMENVVLIKIISQDESVRGSSLPPLKTDAFPRSAGQIEVKASVFPAFAPHATSNKWTLFLRGWNDQYNNLLIPIALQSDTDAAQFVKDLTKWVKDLNQTTQTEVSENGWQTIR